MTTANQALVIAATLAVAGLAAPALGVPTLNGDDAATSNGPPRVGGGGGGDSPWVSPQTIQLNMLLYQMREQVAAGAAWHGPGPADIRLRVPQGFDDGAVPAPRPAPLGTTAPKKVPGVAKLRGASASRAGGRTVVLEPSPSGGGHDPRSLARSNLWPNGEIPYTFSDFMIESFFFPGPDPDPPTFNAGIGIANALAVMILLEQETPLRFVGYDPTQHTVGGILVWDSISDGWDSFEDGPPPPFELDELAEGTDNFVTRIGRSPQPTNPDIPPTTISHGYWQNFPSIIRSVGFAIGLDWEQRHPNRDEYIIVHPENIPPAFGPDGLGWPRSVTGNGNSSPGFPAILEDASFGQQLFAIAQNDPTVFPVGDFDLDSIMLLNHLGYNNVLPMYTIRDEFRYRDLNGDDIIDTTPFGPDDIMFSGREPIYFSAGDLTSIFTLYTPVIARPCPADLNDDGFINDLDIQLYLAWYNARDVRAELTGDVCIDANGDGIADNDCIDIRDLVQFFVLLQQSTDCGATGNIGGANTLDPV
jgi:hypothetical protein